MSKLISPTLKTSGNQKLRELLEKNPALLDEVADAAIFNNIAFELLSLRRESGLTQKELAEKIDLRQSHISRWERPGYQGYKIKVLSKLARTLGGSLQISLLPRKSNYTMSISYTETHKDSLQIVHPDGTSITKSSTRSNSTTLNIPVQGVVYATN